MSSDHRKLSTAAELETKHQRTLEEKNAQFAMCIPGLGGQSNQPKGAFRRQPFSAYCVLRITFFVYVFST